MAIFEEDTVRIADGAALDLETLSDKKGTRRILDPAKVTAARQRIEVRFRHLKAGKPQKWGEVSTLITKTDDPNDPSKYDDAELEKRIADIEAKDAFIARHKVA